MSSNDLESLLLFNEPTELTVLFLSSCKGLIETTAECHAPLRTQLLDDIIPMTIYAGSIYEKFCTRSVSLVEVTTFSSKNKIFKAMMSFLPELENQAIDIDSVVRLPFFLFWLFLFFLLFSFISEVPTIRSLLETRVRFQEKGTREFEFGSKVAQVDQCERQYNRIPHRRERT
jgi:hypothetical protein